MPNHPPDEAAVRAALAEFQDPETGRSVVALEQVHTLHLEGDCLSIVLGLTMWSAPLWEQVRTELAEHLQKRLPGLSVVIEIEVHQRKPEKLGGIGLAAKTVVAVGSGKGGVGKSPSPPISPAACSGPAAKSDCWTPTSTARASPISSAATSRRR